jgi:drug/metabolite transporter (DMT)-like permease
LFLVQISVLHVGADYTSPAYAVILINSNPIFANLIAHFVVPEDRLTGLRVLGLGFAFVGVVFVSLGRPDLAIAKDPVFGNFVVLVSAVLVAARLVYTQRLVQRIEPTKLVFWQMVLALPGFAAAFWFMPGQPRGDVTWHALVGVAYQGAVVSGLTFMAWAILLQRHSPGSLSVFSFTVPIFGVLLSAWLFEEVLTARLIFGVLAVTGGIAIATRAGRKAVYDAQPDANEP